MVKHGNLHISASPRPVHEASAFILTFAVGARGIEFDELVNHWVQALLVIFVMRLPGGRSVAHPPAIFFALYIREFDNGVF